MDYRIALSPELDIQPADFVTAWNDDTEAHNEASASLSPSSGAQFDPTLITDVLLGVTTGMAGNALYDLIKKFLVKQGVRKHTHIEEMKKPDGTRLLVIDIEEK